MNIKRLNVATASRVREERREQKKRKSEDGHREGKGKEMGKMPILEDMGLAWLIIQDH